MLNSADGVWEGVNEAQEPFGEDRVREVIRASADRSAASTSHVTRFETKVRAHLDNLATLVVMPGERVNRGRERRQMKILILDLSVSRRQLKVSLATPGDGQFYPARTASIFSS